MKNPRAVPKTLGEALRMGFAEAGAINMHDMRTGTMEMVHRRYQGMLLVPFRLQFGRPYRGSRAFLR